MCRWCQCDHGDECCDTREMAAAGTTEVPLGRRTATTREGEGEATGACTDAARRRRYIATGPATPLHGCMTTRRQRYIATGAAGRGGWAARPGTTGTYAQFGGVPQGRDWCEGLGRRPLPSGYIATALHGYSRLGLALEPGGWDPLSNRSTPRRAGAGEGPWGAHLSVPGPTRSPPAPSPSRRGRLGPSGSRSPTQGCVACCGLRPRQHGGHAQRPLVVQRVRGIASMVAPDRRRFSPVSSRAVRGSPRPGRRSRPRSRRARRGPRSPGT